MTRNYPALLAMLLLILLNAQKMTAQSFIPMDLEQLSNGAEIIISGEVTDIEYGWTDETNMPRTYVTVDPRIVVKDSSVQKPEGPVIITFLGGMVDSKYFSPIGVLEFKMGDNWFFFLVSDEITREYYVVGAKQGMSQIIDNYVYGPEKTLMEYIQMVRSIIDSNQ